MSVRRLLGIYMFVLLLFGPLSSEAQVQDSTDTKQEIRELRLRAGAAIEQHRPEIALEAMDLLLTLKPDDPTALGVEAEAYYMMGDTSQARSQAERAVSLEPNVPAGHFALGELSLIEQSWSEAIRHLENVTTHSSSFAGGHELLGIAYFRSGNFRSALEELRIAIRLSASPDLEIYRYLGRTLLALNRPREALDAWEVCSVKWPKVLEVQLGLGMSLCQLNEPDSAALALRRAAELDSNYAGVWLGLGWISMYKSEWSQAESQILRSLSLDSNQVQAHVYLRTIYAKLGRDSASNAELRKAAEMDSSLIGWQAKLVGWYLPGDTPGTVVEKTVGKDSLEGTIDVLMTLATALGNTGDCVRATQAYQNALKQDSTIAQAHLGLAVCLSLAGDWTNAWNSAKRAVIYNPRNPLAHYCLGRAAAKLGDNTSAWQEYELIKLLDVKVAANYRSEVFKQ